MAASASVALDTGETVMPYENGSLAYSRETEIKSTVNGTVEWTGLIDYLSVSAGQQLLRISGDDSENEIFSLEQSLKTARETLETAQKNLDNMNAVAPINGTVLAVGITPGAEITAGTATISIADTTVMLIDANVDERNISYIQPGMMVNLDQWGTMFTGVVDSVSLSGKVENGVSTFPAVISVDNPDGMMMTGSSVTYSLVASQNDNCLILPIQCVKYVQLDDGSTGTVVFVKGERPDSAIDLSFPVEGVPEGFWAVPVETGIADTYNVEIKSGVEEGVEVFTAVQTMNAWM